MALRIETFSNEKGGNAFFKAIGHPLAAQAATGLLTRLHEGSLAIYDPKGFLTAFDEIYPLTGCAFSGLFVQDLERVNQRWRGQVAKPISALGREQPQKLFIVDFDSDRAIQQLKTSFPSLRDDGVEIITLDSLKLPEDMTSRPQPYVQPMNFATNLVLFQDAPGRHSRLTTANYWGRYGAEGAELYCHLFAENGETLAQWREPLGSAEAPLVLDSREVRRRFDLPDFQGQLFLHVLRPAGHDIVKYALDIIGDDCQALTSTHDTNTWPADLYAGLPAPHEGERVLLWIQNAHPCEIPAGAISIRAMGSSKAGVPWTEVVEPYGTKAIEVSTLLPNLRWPAQIEIMSGRHIVRPRYEVVAASGRSLMAHANVERGDLAPDPKIAQMAAHWGKGFILPAPILPRSRFRSLALPTPMASSQENMPLMVKAYSPKGQEIFSRSLGNLSRNHQQLLDFDALLAPDKFDWGHYEITYDFDSGTDADGWLHALFRFEDKQTGHAAESSFGSHVFNTLVTYKGEPQSYNGPPPGLSTRLFLRLGPRPLKTFCHLIYPASTPWHPESNTALQLYSQDGKVIAQSSLKIDCGGSSHWRPDEHFSEELLNKAGYIIVRDQTCRLFGYHGLEWPDKDGSFSIDHMFGF